MAIFLPLASKKWGAANCTKDLFGKKRPKLPYFDEKKRFNSSCLDHRFLSVASIYIVGFEIFKTFPSNN